MLSLLANYSFSLRAGWRLYYVWRAGYRAGTLFGLEQLTGMESRTCGKRSLAGRRVIRAAECQTMRGGFAELFDTGFVK